MPDGTGVDVCIAAGATVVVRRGTFSVGELTVSRGSALTVGAAATAGTAATAAPGDGDRADRRKPGGRRRRGERRDPHRRALRHRRGEPDPRRTHHQHGGPRGRRLGRHRERGGVDADQLGHRRRRRPAACSTSRAPRPRRTRPPASSPSGSTGRPPPRPTTAASRTGRSRSAGARTPCSTPGSPPPPGSEYDVYTGSYSGTFATVGHDAKADYSRPGDVGLVGGAPAAATTVAVTGSVPRAVFGQGGAIHRHRDAVVGLRPDRFGRRSAPDRCCSAVPR